VIAAFSRIAAWARRIWRREPPRVESIALPIEPMIVESVVIDFPERPAPRKRAERKKISGDEESGGGFYFRGAILDHLEQYFVYIRRMKRADPAAYALFSQIGASVLPDGMEIAAELSSYWKEGNRPGFGAVALGIGVEEKEDRIHGKFMYFRKLNRAPVTVEPSNGTVYELVGYYDKLKDKWLGRRRSGIPISMHISIDNAGAIRPLRELRTRYRNIKSKSKRGSFDLPVRGWDFPSALYDWAQDNKFIGKDRLVDFVHKAFCLVANSFEQSGSHVRVSVSQGSDLASFGIDIKRTPYFFTDRELVLNEHGSKARIFHIVRAHKRTYADGREKYIKFHFRGLRDFDWNGYRVHISFPGLHHNNLIEMDIGGHVFEKDEPLPPGMVEEAKMGKMIARHLQQ
jgi:hypothetical protein